MAKKQTEGNEESFPVNRILETLRSQQEAAGFDQFLELTADEEAAAIVWGQYQGVETPRILLLAQTPHFNLKYKKLHIQSREKV